jgi:transcription antitermination factor NusG
MFPEILADDPEAFAPEALVANHEERRWYALVVKARHEKAAEQVLSDKGFDTFLPLYVRRHYYAGRRRDFQVPLFPGYLFCRFHTETMMTVLRTPSVIQVVGIGRTPVPIDENEVESLRIAAGAAAAMSPHPYLTAGRKVRVVSGPLAGVEGIVTEMKNPVRLVLSITMLQRSVSVTLDARHVAIE